MFMFMFIFFVIGHSYNQTYNVHTSIYTPFIQLWVAVELPAGIAGTFIAVWTLPVAHIVAIFKTDATNHFRRITGEVL
jgi:hypothetical protein